MPGIVHFAAIAVGVVVCAFIGTQLATLRGLHVRSIEAGIAAGKGALRGFVSSCFVWPAVPGAHSGALRASVYTRTSPARARVHARTLART